MSLHGAPDLECEEGTVLMKVCIPYRILFSTLALLAMSHVRCTADDNSEAVRLGEQFMLDAEFVLDRGFFVVAVINVESSPDSDLLFKSRVYTELFQESERRFEFFETNPTIIADDRAAEKKQLDGPMGAQLDKSKRLYLKSGTYDMLDKYSDPIVSPKKVWEKSSTLRFGSTVVNPYDWPHLSFGSFSKSGERNLAKSIFGEDRECIYAKDDGQKLDTHWVKKDQFKSIKRVCFRRERPVLMEVYYFHKGFKADSYKLSDGVLILRTETEWGSQKGNEDVFPKRVVSTQFNGPASSAYTKYVGDIQVYHAEHDEFKKKSKEIEDAVKKIVDLPQVQVGPLQ